jgi:hypothetical protein
VKKNLKLGDELICSRERGLGFTVGKSYKVYYISGNRVVSMLNDYQSSASFYITVTENECVALLWDYFDNIKDIRKKKLKKLKIFLDEKK